MNLFKQYGIKEVADVVFYSITKVGDEEFYTPVLVLDTLKVSTIEKSAEKVVALDYLELWKRAYFTAHRCFIQPCFNEFSLGRQIKC